MGLRKISGILNVSKHDLNLNACLRGGMSFRWTKLSDTEFVGVIRHRIVRLKQNPCKIEFVCYESKNEEEKKISLSASDDHEQICQNELTDYFRLGENLQELYKDWSRRDEKFKQRVETYPDVLQGIRVLRLDPVENLFSFICSSNNNIKRITQMVANMCKHFGQLIGQLDDIDYYSFPTIDRLTGCDVEEKLRALNFGYRAKFIHQAAVYLSSTHSEKCVEWLYSLRNENYNQVAQELIKVPGIGKKVADCICLMSMDKLEAIPVDTHVLSLARNLYDFVPCDMSKKKTKSNTMSDKNYRFIGEKFRELWGEYAGWAQTVMFIDDLKGFQKEKLETTALNIKQEAAEINHYASKTIKVEPGSSVELVNVKTESIKRSSSSNSLTNKKRVRKNK